MKIEWVDINTEEFATQSGLCRIRISGGWLFMWVDVNNSNVTAMVFVPAVFVEDERPK